MSDEALFRLNYTPDYADTFAVQRQSIRYHYSASQRHVWWLLLPVWIGAAFVTTRWDDRVQEVLEPHAHPLVVAWAPSALLFVVMFSMWWIVCRWLAPMMSARWLAQRKAPQPIEFQALPERLQWLSEDGGRWVRWSSVERMFVTPTAVCFLVADMTQFVPRSAFADAAGLRSFVETSLTRISEPARQLSLADKSVKAVLAAGI